jgi:hypothetical protein
MADQFSCRLESANLDGPPRPPTFVQIRAPAAAGTARRKLGVVGVGLALATALGWAAYRLSVEQVAPTVTQAAPTVTQTLSPQQVPADLYPELARLTTDASVFAPAWSQESLMDWVSPFDPSVPDRGMLSDAPPADTRNATQAGSYEVSVRLGKGDTIGKALQIFGFAVEAVADAVSALTPHVSLKRLPIGLGMTLQIRSSGEGGAKPILQALTLQPEGRREVTVERDDEGNYAVELRDRSTVR